LGFETTAVSKALKNAKINEMIISYREKRGMKNLSRGKTYPLLIEALKKGECLIIMIDQDTMVKGVFVDFMGKQAYTPIGAARLALDTKAPVVPMAMMRMPDNKHKFQIMPAVPLVDTGNDEHDLLENTKNYTRAIEELIKQAPDQWVWMHERWKSTPEDVMAWERKKMEEKQKEKAAN
jgi:KDO2-lipid IV(A) lauroyltransferase